MFALLQASRRRAIDPSAFCAAFRDFDGSCLQPYEQRDAEEFLNELLQRVEETCGVELLDEYLGGAFAQQMLWHGDDGQLHRNPDRAEPFRVLPLEVKGNETVEEALRQVRPTRTTSRFPHPTPSQPRFSRCGRWSKASQSTGTWSRRRGREWTR